MLLLQKITLILHITAGFTALVTGLVAMLAKKGGGLHTTSGKIYSWAMGLIAASSTLTFLLKPYANFLTFLLFIGLFSFYLTFTGYRAVIHKRTGYRISWLDWTASGMAMTCGLLMVGLAGWYGWHGDVFYGVLYTIFGYFNLSASGGDIRQYRRPAPGGKHQWFFQHMVRMLGAYIATVTAFCVLNVHFLPPLLVWMLPGVLGGTGIYVWVRHYQKRLGPGKLRQPIS